MTNIWMGTEASYSVAVSSMQKIADKKIQANCDDNNNNPDDPCKEDINDYLEVIDGVAVIHITGSLVDATVGRMGKYYGITGYGDIQKAAVAAVRDPEVSSILLNIKSPGGDVSGVKETGELLANIDKIKPVTTYASSSMGSAALWLGVSGREVIASDTAIVGSIGTLMVMASRHRQLKEGGVDAVVVRSGKYKALGHPVDELSDEAVAQAQEKADYLADIFLSYVAERRRVSKSLADSKFGQGREFIGQQALAVGLVDRVSSYPDAYKYAKSLASNANQGRILTASALGAGNEAYNPPKAKGQTSMHLPTPEELATMAGLDLTTETAADAQASAVSDTEAIVAAAVLQDTNALSQVQQELANMEKELTQAKAELTQATAQARANDVQLNELSGIVLASLKSMTVALGGTATSVEAVAVSDLAKKYAEVSAEFKSKFRAGGVSRPAAKITQEVSVTQKVNPLFLAAATLNKFSPKGK